MVGRSLVIFALAAMLAVACSDGDSDPATPTATATSEPTAATATADPGRIILKWTREGGIAGFCDGMTVSANHQASLGTCTDPAADVSDQLLPVDWIGPLERWRDRVASFESIFTDPPNQSDRMTVTIRFEGRGTATASEAEQRELAELATELFNALRQVQPRVDVR